MRSRVQLLVAAVLASFLLVSAASATGRTVPAGASRITSGAPVTNFAVGTSAMFNSPTKLVAGSDGSLWFIYDNNNGYGKITPTGVVSAANWDNSVSRHVADLAAGPDGNVWYTLCTGAPFVPSIAKITPTLGFTAYGAGTPSGYFQGGCPRGITAGPDGNMWFTDAHYVGKITMSGQVTEYDVLPSNGTLVNIVAGPDGNLWATDTGADQIAQISPSGGLVKLWQLRSGRGPESIVVGPDHNLWITEVGADLIGKLTTAGVLTEYTTGTDHFAYAGDSGIIVGPDGNLWFTQCPDGEIAKITTAGVVTEYASDGGAGCPNGIAAGSDGNIWFADEGTNQIGRVSPSYTATPTTTPAPTQTPKPKPKLVPKCKSGQKSSTKKPCHK